MEVNISPKVKCRTRRTRGRVGVIWSEPFERFDTFELPAVLAFNAARTRWRERLASDADFAAVMECEISLFEELLAAGWDLEPAPEMGVDLLHAPHSLTGPGYKLTLAVADGFLGD